MMKNRERRSPSTFVLTSIFSRFSSRSHITATLAASFLISTYIAAGPAFAAVSEVSFTGTYSGKDETTTSLKILMSTAGSAGAIAQCTAFPCDTCKGTSSAGNPDVCSYQYIRETDAITFNFKAGAQGFGKVVGVTTTGATNLIEATTNQPAAGTTISISVTWQEICQRTSSSGLCSTDHTGYVDVGIGADQTTATLTESQRITVIVMGSSSIAQTTACGDTTQRGMCDFRLFAGDEKAYVEADDNGNMPSAGNSTNFDRLRFFYEKIDSPTGDCTTVTVNNNSPGVDIGIDQDGTTTFLESDILNDLENDKTYCFRGTSIDQANNVGYWAPAANVSVTPSEVIGYFTKEQNCFIASAAYGSRLDPRVQTFRDFRDHVLARFGFGRAFIGYYYRNAYAWGAALRKNEFARQTARFALWPAWAFAKLSLLISWPIALLLFGAPVALAARFAARELRAPAGARRARWFIFVLAGALALGASSDAFGAVKKKKSERKPAADAPPQEAPFTTPSEDDEDPTPLKDPKPKRRVAPQAAPGREPEVVRITKEGAYIYKRNPSEQKSAVSLRGGTFNVSGAVNPETGLAFEEVYDSSGVIVFFDYEWQLLRGIGKLGLKFGTGIYAASGDGRFLNNTALTARERYTFVMFPNNISAIYRLQYWDKQIIVPFVEGGGGYYTFVEVRDDFKRTKYGGVPIGQFAVGGSLLLDFLDPSAMVEMDEDHGINHLWLTAEYRYIESFKDDFDISNSMFSAGFLFEF
ncbi:MAG TPA: CFI-box-CTERM domain-containing protein [Bdellovibrionales bacterium]|nr:CFI-box-CTERM domain-containing protein [Bdellovibrionales bacterium]